MVDAIKEFHTMYCTASLVSSCLEAPRSGSLKAVGRFDVWGCELGSAPAERRQPLSPFPPPRQSQTVGLGGPLSPRLALRDWSVGGWVHVLVSAP